MEGKVFVSPKVQLKIVSETILSPKCLGARSLERLTLQAEVRRSLLRRIFVNTLDRKLGAMVFR